MSLASPQLSSTRLASTRPVSSRLVSFSSIERARIGFSWKMVASLSLFESPDEQIASELSLAGSSGAELRPTLAARSAAAEAPTCLPGRRAGGPADALPSARRGGANATTTPTTSVISPAGHLGASPLSAGGAPSGRSMEAARAGRRESSRQVSIRRRVHTHQLAPRCAAGRPAAASKPASKRVGRAAPSARVIERQSG